MYKYAIVVVGYNRPISMQRLFNSLKKCFYGNDNVTLIISIDNSGADEVKKCADNFFWEFGEKKIVTYPKRQGLRKHILHCGNFLYDYDAIAVLEDDIVVAPGFYSYMKATVEKYYNNDQVAGISLYNHLWNVHVNMPFEPAPTLYDTYFLQFAQSWGQIWMKNQWFEFKKWYQQNKEEFNEIDGIPTSVCGWPSSSWLKYHIRYCIERDKYFVYPYKALSTCFADAGEHWKSPDTHLQVPLLLGEQREFRFPEFETPDCVIYDSYFERKWRNCRIAGVIATDISVNLYGYKKNNEGKRYILSMRTLPYKKSATFGLQYRPHELNAVLNAQGEDIILYDTSIPKKIQKKSHNEVKEFQYRFKLYGKTKLLINCIAYNIMFKFKKLYLEGK